MAQAGTADLRWYRWNIRKYRNSDRVLALSCLAAHGAYRNLLDAYMEKGKLPRDRRALWKLALAPSQADYETVAEEVEALFIVSECGNVLLHDTADIERREAVQKMEQVSEVRIEAGRKGAAKRWQTDGNSIAKPLQAIAHNSTEQNITGEKQKQGLARATRLPHDFQVTPEHRFFAINNDLPSPDDHIAEFRDYWMAKPGAAGKKLDWDATFRNWLRKAKQFQGTSNGRKAQVSQDEQRRDFEQLMAESADGESSSQAAVPKQHLLANTRAKAAGAGGLVSISSADREGEIH